jgi:hypothetical protein
MMPHLDSTEYAISAPKDTGAIQDYFRDVFLGGDSQYEGGPINIILIWLAIGRRPAARGLHHTIFAKGVGTT